jgi:hypothetical protein
MVLLLMMVSFKDDEEAIGGDWNCVCFNGADPTELLRHVHYRAIGSKASSVNSLLHMRCPQLCLPA